MGAVKLDNGGEMRAGFHEANLRENFFTYLLHSRLSTTLPTLTFRAASLQASAPRVWPATRLIKRE